MPVNVFPDLSGKLLDSRCEVCDCRNRLVLLLLGRVLWLWTIRVLKQWHAAFFIVRKTSFSMHSFPLVVDQRPHDCDW